MFMARVVNEEHSILAIGNFEESTWCIQMGNMFARGCLCMLCADSILALPDH